MYNTTLLTTEAVLCRRSLESVHIVSLILCTLWLFALGGPLPEPLATPILLSASVFDFLRFLNHVVLCSFCPSVAYFTLHSVFWIHLYCHKWQNSHLFRAERYSTVYKYHIFFSYSSAYRHLLIPCVGCCEQCRGGYGLQILLWDPDFSSYEYIPGVGMRICMIVLFFSFWGTFEQTLTAALAYLLVSMFW